MGEIAAVARGWVAGVGPAHRTAGGRACWQMYRKDNGQVGLVCGKTFRKANGQVGWK